MAMNKQASDPIVLGSGELYLGLVSGIENVEELTTIEEEALTNVGAIDGGASFTIGTEFTEVKSTNRGLIKKVPIDKNVSFATGIMTWVMESLSKFCTGATYTDDIEKKVKKMVVGLGDSTPIVYLRFVHKKEDGSGTITVNIYKAQFDGDVVFEFSDTPTTINYAFTGLTNDNNNYLEVVETY